MQREIEIRGWYDEVIRKKRTARNKRIIVYKKGEKRNYFKNNFENEITNKRLYSQRASVNYEWTAKIIIIYAEVNKSKSLFQKNKVN